jgi:hypothetical protein
VLAERNSRKDVWYSNQRRLYERIKTMKDGLGAKLIEVPKNLALATKPKIVDFTEIDLYPSKYTYKDGIVRLKSIILEDISRQDAAFKRLNTTVYIGDSIKIDIKFGHFQDGEWIDLYYKGVLKVRAIRPLTSTCEILMLLSER